MTTLSQIARPLRWLAAFKARGTHEGVAAFATGVTATHTPAEATTGTVQWVGNCLTLPCRVDAKIYLAVIAAAKQMVAAGMSEIVVDLRHVERIESSGLFALHCIVLAMCGKPVPDPEDGWGALRSAAAQNLSAGRCERVKLINGSGHVTAKLQANQLDDCLLIVP